MKVLWFSDAAMPAVRDKLGILDLGNRAGWVANMSREISAQNGIELGIVWSSALVTENFVFTEGNITYYCIPRGGWMEEIGRRLRSSRAIRNIWQLLTYIPRSRISGPLRDCQRVIDQYRPDIVHVHGTEAYYGLLGASCKTPLIVSLQGILSEYAKVYWGSIPVWKRPFFPREVLLHTRMKFNAARETRILRMNRYFSGRTHWDRETLLRINPRAQYHSDGARVLRPQFYGPEWSLDECIRHRIYTTITPRPYKGTDTLIEALALIKDHFPSASLCIGGHLPEHGVGGYFRNRINELGLSSRVELVGFVEAEDIVSHLQAANVYVLGSHIENSPNSVAEAQTVGTPCIATSAGGTSSMVEDGISGLLYRAGNAAELARALDRVFSDDRLCRELSRAERETARKRGDIRTNVNKLIEIYTRILAES